MYFAAIKTINTDNIIDVGDQSNNSILRYIPIVNTQY